MKLMTFKTLIKRAIVLGTKDNFLRERLFREWSFTLSKRITADHAAEETLKYVR